MPPKMYATLFCTTYLKMAANTLWIIFISLVYQSLEVPLTLLKNPIRSIIRLPAGLELPASSVSPASADPPVILNINIIINKFKK